MSVSPAYAQLIDELCLLVMIPHPASLYETANLSVRGVDFTFFYQSGSGSGDILVYAGFGSLPDARRQDVTQRLLETNLTLFNGPFSPSFAFNPQTQQVLLVSNVLMEGVTAQALLDLLGHMAELALEWRGSFFLDQPCAAPAETATCAQSGEPAGRQRPGA